MNEAANPKGPNRKPNPNHKHPFAPRPEATRVAPIPQKIQIIAKIKISKDAPSPKIYQ
jgi:hypothetical protein